MNFMDALRARWSKANSLVCVGLDPEPAKFPAQFRDDPDAVFGFCRDIVDATAGFACCFKPQVAHFAALGAEGALERLIAHIHDAHPGIPVILDAKRGDIGSTAQRYAAEAFDRYRADAVTANPYLGRDSLQPFLDRIATHIIAFEGDSHVEFFQGNYREYEEDKKRRLGDDAGPHRLRFKALK